MTTSTTEAKKLIGEIKLLCELADGWEDGETFYVDTINSIRDLLAEQPAPAALPVPSISEDEAVERVARSIFEAYSSDETAQEWARGTSWDEATYLAAMNKQWRRITGLARKEARAALAAIEQPAPNQSPAAACDDTQSYKKAYEILRDAMQFCRPEHVTREALSHAEAAIASPDIEKE